jgi:uncharacterized RDD family membrane protein YckC
MMDSEFKPVNTGNRIVSMLLDHFFMCIIGFLVFLPGTIHLFSEAFKVSHDPPDFTFFNGGIKYYAVFSLALYICKDTINGRSLAKRIMKFQVVDNKTGRVASPMQCMVRNLFIAIWIIEVFVAIANPYRRIGDRVAGTRLVNYDPYLLQPKIDFKKIISPLIVSFGAMCLLILLTPSIKFPRTELSKTSYNPTESKELEKLLSDSLGQYFTPDIRIYDTVKNKPIKYISTILRLKDNYISDQNSYQLLDEITTRIIYSRYPSETFTGKLQYVFQGKGQFQSRTTTIGN